MISTDDVVGNVTADDCERISQLTQSEHQSLRALYRGEASQGQQREALALIVNKFCRTHDLHFIPGSPDRSGFLAGRAFIGMQILHILNIPVGKMQYQKTKPEEA